MASIICKDLDNCNVTDFQAVTRILVPFNASKHAPNVFGKALTIAKLYGASICVVSVVNKDLARGWVNGTPSRQSAMSRRRGERGKKGLAKM